MVMYEADCKYKWYTGCSLYILSHQLLTYQKSFVGIVVKIEIKIPTVIADALGKAR